MNIDLKTGSPSVKVLKASLLHDLAILINHVRPPFGIALLARVLHVCSTVLAMAHDLSSKTSVRMLNDGNEIPIFGLGVWRSEPGGEAEQAVSWALKHGYRLIDTAAIYK